MRAPTRGAPTIVVPQCPHCSALLCHARIALHCPALLCIASYCLALPRNDHHGAHGIRCSAMRDNACQCEHCSASLALLALLCIASHCPHCFALLCIARYCSVLPALPCIAPHRPSWRSSRTLLGKDDTMIVGAPLVGARNADNACQCEHCPALPRIALHCPALRASRALPPTDHHSDHRAHCSARMIR